MLSWVPTPGGHAPARPAARRGLGAPGQGAVSPVGGASCGAGSGHRLLWVGRGRLPPPPSCAGLGLSCTHLSAILSLWSQLERTPPRLHGRACGQGPWVPCCMCGHRCDQLARLRRDPAIRSLPLQQGREAGRLGGWPCCLRRLPGGPAGLQGGVCRSPRERPQSCFSPAVSHTRGP